MEVNEYYNQILNLFIKKPIPNKVLDDYLEGKNDSHLEVVDHINMNIKKEFSWMTGMFILEMADNAFYEAAANANIRYDKEAKLWINENN